MMDSEVVDDDVSQCLYTATRFDAADMLTIKNLRCAVALFNGLH